MHYILTIISKLVGLAIITASTIVKLPQILIIWRSGSIEGLSVASFEMELVGYTVALSYCIVNGLAFTAYGELLFLLIQAFILVILLYRFSPRLGITFWIKAGMYSAVAPLLLTGSFDHKVYEWLYTFQTVLFTLSRVPQIWTNFQSGGTGQLSAATTFMNFGGCIARIFTSLLENAPTSMIIGSLLGMVAHGTLLSQLVFYNVVRGGAPPKVHKLAKEE